MKKRVIVSLVMVAAITVTGCGNTKVESKTKEVKTEKVVSKEVIQKKESIPKRYQELVKMLENIYDFEVPYFGGYSMKDKQMVVFSHEDKKAVIWNHDGKNKTKVINYNDIKEDYKLSSFAEGNLNNRKTIFVEFESPESTFNLGIHEGYHFYGQRWIDRIVKESRPRGTYYPENVEAQYLTFDMYQKLKEHIETKDKDKLGESINLFNKLLRNHKSDVEGDLSVNVAESTANFIERMYLAAAKNPDQKSDLKEIAKKAYKIEENELKNYGSADKYEKSFGYYKINALPYFYLAMEGKSDKIERIHEMRFPYALLKEIGNEKEAKENEELKKEVKDYYKTQNDRMKPIVEEFKKAFNSNEYVKIKIKGDIFPGSMQFGEFINFKHENEYYTINTNTVAKSTESKGVSFEDINTLTDLEGNFVVYVSKEVISENDKILKVKTNNLDINTQSYEKRENEYIIK